MNTRIKSLRAEIKRHNRLYWIDNTPEISDTEYDKLVLELETLENKISEPASNLTKGIKHVHLTPFDTIKKHFNIDTFISEVVSNPNGVLSVKYDGQAINIQYYGGILVRAMLRGNGRIGNDVTNAALAVTGIPHTIPIMQSCEIRGEVYISLSDYRRKNLGYATPRDYASTSLLLTDQAAVAKRKLKFAAWQFIGVEPQSYIPTVKTLPISDVNSQSLANAMDKIKAMGIPADGIVYAIPGGKTIAYKFPSSEVQTIFIGISWSKSAKGRLTPFAVYKPVTIDGITTYKCNLHNQETIDSLKLQPGCTITIHLTGSSAPEIINTETNGHPETLPEPPATYRYSHEIYSGLFGGMFELLEITAARMGMKATRKDHSRDAIISYNSLNQLADICYNLGTII